MLEDPREQHMSPGVAAGDGCVAEQERGVELHEGENDTSGHDHRGDECLRLGQARQAVPGPGGHVGQELTAALARVGDAVFVLPRPGPRPPEVPLPPVGAASAPEGPASSSV